MVTLLRVATGEDWHRIMFDLGHVGDGCEEKKQCGTRKSNFLQIALSSVFFVCFLLMCSFVMLNLFILVILQQFDEYYLPKDNVLEKFKNDLETFKESWKKFSERYNGIKIRDS
jgi:hypothetical protein